MIDLKKETEKYKAKDKETLREHTDGLLVSAKTLYELGYISKEVYEKQLVIADEYHDYGKMNEYFQARVGTNKKFDESKEIGHNLLSVIFVPKEEIDDEDYYKICYAILNHHHHVNNLEVFNEKSTEITKIYKKWYGEEGKRQFRKSFLKKLKNLNGNLNAVLLTGYLQKCDYSASGKYTIEYPNDFLLSSLNNMGYKWNPLQEYMLKNTDENLMVVANTGMGKTEAGLLWIGDNKGFFILPLRTAINAIYKRVSENIVKEKIEERVVLLHSEAFSYFLSNTENNKAHINYEKVKKYISDGRNLSIPLTISTLDQLFDFVFEYPGYEIKLATLSYSKIVLDEIQAYSPDLLAYIVIGLKKITDAGGKFAILTATLPPFIRDYITKDISNIKYKTFIEGKNRHNIFLYQEKINFEYIYNHYKKKKGKTLVVCNTIRKAQEVYEYFKDKSDCEVEMLHSKYIKSDRKEKEERILEFGDTKVKGNKIWIATNIVEASLDIDFDYLFTELSDLSGLFQRIGRVNRKGEKEDMLSEPNVFIFTEIDKLLISKEGFIDKKIYELSRDALLKKGNGILSEKDKYNLIEENLTTENVAGSNFDEKFNKFKDYLLNKLKIETFSLAKVKKEFRNILSYKAIPLYIYEENKERIDKLKEEASSSIEAKFELDKYTISLGYYDIENNNQSNERDRLKLKYEDILIVEGKYSKEKGFERKINGKHEGELDSSS